MTQVLPDDVVDRTDSRHIHEELEIQDARAKDFDAIAKSLEGATVYTSPYAIVGLGDSLDLLARLPDQSISMILTDPPYHSTKKKNIAGDTSFASDQEFVNWMGEFAKEWKRVLRPNGSLYCFCSSAMAAQLEIEFSREFNVLSQIVWTKPNDPGFDGWKGKMKKEALRQWYPHSERILFCEPAVDGNLKRSPFGEFLREKRLASGLTGHQLTELTGAYGKVNHGGAVSNWETGRNIPSRDQYRKICEAILDTGKVRAMPKYEDVVRKFGVDKSKQFTDVWDFPSVRPYRGKHPAEKPESLLRHAIEASTFEGDIVLDCFAGSGSTSSAAISVGRRSVAIELEPKWAEAAIARVRGLMPPIGVLEEDEDAIPERNQVSLFE